MGIPRFYRYMSERYPLINQPISDVSLLPEFDAFYLDMNGIVHNCTHSDTDHTVTAQPLEAQLDSICTTLDRLVTHIIKPKQLVYIAIDGVAPRAKLNQQRSRRFRAGMDRQAALHNETLVQAHCVDAPRGSTTDLRANSFDSNCITPGTDFMTQLSRQLVAFVRHKMKSDAVWARLEVYFSGSEVPGEGEHKIVEFIRHRKMAVDYAANVRHCMYGSDADLMLLGLLTHEPHFTLVRETIVWRPARPAAVVRKPIHEPQWQLVHLSLLREYLLLEMTVEPACDGERMLDDFILLTFLLGNDFIPHSPTLEIRDDAIPLLLTVYCTWLRRHDGQYLTRHGTIVNAPFLQDVLHDIGSREEDMLSKRAMEATRRSQGRRPPPPPHKQVLPAVGAMVAVDDDDDDDAERALLEALDGKDETEQARALEHETLELGGSKSFQATKWQYYEQKFKIPCSQGHARTRALAHVKRAYVEALVWCLGYYFQGPPSWAWFYPYHYAPMVSDLTDIANVLTTVSFAAEPGPLLPFEQLLANLPASSAHLVPKPYRFLMVSPLSPIKHFYPETFAIDMDNKRHAWEGVNLLPFIDVAVLQEAIAQYCPESLLTDAERQRNTLQVLPVRIVHDATVVETLVSPLSGRGGLSDVHLCHPRVESYALPPLPDGEYQSKLMDQVILPLAGFPSLYTVSLAATRIACVGLNCFGMRSRKASLILELAAAAKDAASCDDGTLQALLGSTVLANWPNLHEGLVVGLSTRSGMYRLVQDKRHSPQTVFTAFGPEDASKWAAYAQTEAIQLLEGRGCPGSGGIDVGPTGISTVLHVLPLQGMIANPDTGAMEKKFGATEARVPAQLAVWNRALLDARFQATSSVPLCERFPVKSTVLVTRGTWLGCTATVQSLAKAPPRVTLQVDTIAPEPPFGYVIAQQLRDQYVPGHVAAHQLGLSPSLFGLVTGSVLIKPSNVDIGLNLRYRKELILPGYCRLVRRDTGDRHDADAWTRRDIVTIVGTRSHDRDGLATLGTATAWEYTHRALRLVAAYTTAFPDVVGRLSRLPFAPSYHAKDVFATRPATASVALHADAVKHWIDAQHVGIPEHATHIPVTSTYVACQAVRAMEAAGTVRATERAHAALARQQAPVVATVTSADLFRLNPLVNQDLTGQDVAACHQRKPTLGDRVVNLCARGVPFGHRGTVVATHVSSQCVEVLFDEGFPGGCALYGTASLDRGKLVAWHTVLCVSRPMDRQLASQAPTRPGPVTTSLKAWPKPQRATASVPQVRPPPPIPRVLPRRPDPERMDHWVQTWSFGRAVATQASLARTLGPASTAQAQSAALSCPRGHCIPDTDVVPHDHGARRPQRKQGAPGPSIVPSPSVSPPPPSPRASYHARRILLPDGSYAPMSAPPLGWYAHLPAPMPRTNGTYDPPHENVPVTTNQKTGAYNPRTNKSSLPPGNDSQKTLVMKSTRHGAVGTTHRVLKEWKPKQTSKATKSPQLLLPSQVMRQQKPQK